MTIHLYRHIVYVKSCELNHLTKLLKLDLIDFSDLLHL